VWIYILPIYTHQVWTRCIYIYIYIYILFIYLFESVYTCYAYPKACKFLKIYFICTLGYIQDVSIFRMGYVPKNQVGLYIYIISVCGCFQFCQYGNVSNSTNFLECGSQTIWHDDQLKAHNECLIHKSLTNFLSCNILYVYV
jgi:hypothetical protein